MINMFTTQIKWLQVKWNLVFQKHNLSFKDWATFQNIKDTKYLVVL